MFIVCPVLAQDDTGSNSDAGGESGSPRAEEGALPATASVLPSNVDAWGLPVLTTKPLTFVGGTSYAQDANLFKTPTASADTITTTGLGLRVNKPYSLQVFQFNINKTYNRYSTFSYLNNAALDYRAAWQWSLTPRISGTMSRDYRESLVPFQEISGSTSRNLRTSEINAFSADAWVTGGWHLLGSINKSAQRSGQSVLASPDTFSLARELGGRFLALSGNSITFTQRSTNGGYLNASAATPVLTANGFRREESEFRGNWRLTGKSTVSGRIAWFEHRQSASSQYDVAGLVGDVTYLWLPTATLQLSLKGQRTLTPTPDPVYTKVVNTVYSLSPTWTMSSKTALRLRLDSSRYAYGGAGTTPLVGPARVDTLNTAELGMSWAALRSLTLDASLQWQQRHSNSIVPIGFDDTVAKVSASVAF